jgi:hypothetical protein
MVDELDMAWEARQQRREARDRAVAHRKPPMARPARGFGWCLWCEGSILYPAGHRRAGTQNLRAQWHPDCVWHYKVAAGWTEARTAVWHRDRGCCALCGRVARGWHLDHIVPLWSVEASVATRGCFWGIVNLQTLCQACHLEKTAREATARAMRRRGEQGPPPITPAGRRRRRRVVQGSLGL